MNPNSTPAPELSVLWAKRPERTGAPSAYHPLLCHSLDVAAVAEAMWAEVLSSAARRQVATALGLGEDAAGRWIAFWAALHDLGKAAPAFQLQVKGDSVTPARLKAAGFSWRDPVEPAPHGAITAREVSALLLEPPFELERKLASDISLVLGGHHGVIPRSDQFRRFSSDTVGRGRWVDARAALTRMLAALVDLPSDRPVQLDKATAMALAGLISVADWIGSNTVFFPYVPQAAGEMPQVDPVAYLGRARRQARDALTRLGWTGWTPPVSPEPFDQLFHFEPVPMQRAVIAVAERLNGPALVMIEAPMGEGKTEAAMYLADHSSATLGQRGCYFALPTQATSNQMFTRVREFLGRRYPRDFVNLQLLHGHAALSAEFAVLRANADRLYRLDAVYEEDGGAHSHGAGEVLAAEWFTYRKRGLLAPFGVGTVDQALLAALQTRHVFVRLFGLGHKTVVLDEIHAYDTYMSTLLERLVEWLAALGATVVLLSATLPRTRRDRLAAAYARGLGAPVADAPQAPYPRVSWVSAAGRGAEHVAPSEALRRTLGLAWVNGRLPQAEGEPFELGKRLKEALVHGGCAAVICNTVGRAQQVFRALRPYFPETADDGQPELDLLHARFLYEERERREQRALVRFGKPGATVQVGEGHPVAVRRPRRAVLVATQVIEQSLDLDFDLMVTDLAPADLLLQRAGRLHRHRRDRPPDLGLPVLWVCLPEAIEEDVPRFGRGTEVIYEAHVLLRSWLALRDRTAIQVPGEVEELIEAVYGDAGPPEGAGAALLGRWRVTLDALQREQERETREAEVRWLKPPRYGGALWDLAADPRDEDAPELHEAHQALTRLADPSVPVVCLYGTLDRPSFDPEGREPMSSRQPPDVDLARRLLRRSVAIADRRIIYALRETRPPAAWRRSPLLREHRLVALDADGAAPFGRYRLRLDPEVGLSVTDPDREFL